MSGKILNWAARAPAGDVTAKCVLLVLAEACDETGATFIGQDTIAERCDLRRETVCGALKRLAARGLISRSQRRRDDGYRSSDLIRLNLCAFTSCEDNAHENRSHVRLTGDLMCAKPDSLTPSMNPQTKDTSSGSPVVEGKVPLRKRNAYPESFEAVWSAYPHCPGRSDKGRSLKVWEALTAEDRAALVGAIAMFNSTPQATKDGGQFVKAFDRWLANGLWRDFVSATPQETQPAPTDWDKRMAAFRENGAWLSTWGEKPGRDGCVVPAEVLARHGLARPVPALRVIGGGIAE